MTVIRDGYKVSLSFFAAPFSYFSLKQLYQLCYCPIFPEQLCQADGSASRENRLTDFSISISVAENLAENTSKLRQVLDMLFDGILIIQDDVITETNQGFPSMSGYEAEEIIGRKMSDLEGWKELALTLANVVSEESVSFESVVPRRHSPPASATWRAVRASSGNSSFLFAVIPGMTANEPA